MEWLQIGLHSLAFLLCIELTALLMSSQLPPIRDFPFLNVFLHILIKFIINAVLFADTDAGS